MAKISEENRRRVMDLIRRGKNVKEIRLLCPDINIQSITGLYRVSMYPNVGSSANNEMGWVLGRKMVARWTCTSCNKFIGTGTDKESVPKGGTIITLRVPGRALERRVLCNSCLKRIVKLPAKAR